MLRCAFLFTFSNWRIPGSFTTVVLSSWNYKITKDEPKKFSAFSGFLFIFYSKDFDLQSNLEYQCLSVLTSKDTIQISLSLTQLWQVLYSLLLVTLLQQLCLFLTGISNQPCLSPPHPLASTTPLPFFGFHDCHHSLSFPWFHIKYSTLTIASISHFTSITEFLRRHLHGKLLTALGFLNWFFILFLPFFFN